MSSWHEIRRVFATESGIEFDLGKVWGVEIGPSEAVYRQAPFDDASYPDVSIVNVLRSTSLETVLAFDEFVGEMNRLFEKEGSDLRLQFMEIYRYIGTDAEPEQMEIAESGDLRETLERVDESDHYRLVYMNVATRAFQPNKRVWVI